MKHTFYVVKNEAGEYLIKEDILDSRWISFIEPETLISEYVTATWRATRYGGTVKRVTIIEEED